MTYTEDSGKIKISFMSQEENGSVPFLFLCLSFVVETWNLPISNYDCQSRYILQCYYAYRKHVAVKAEELQVKRYTGVQWPGI